MKSIQIVNLVGHIIAGGALVYLFIPSASFWVQLLFIAGLAALREHIQNLRPDHKQSTGSRITDVIEFTVGALIVGGALQMKWINADSESLW